MQKILDKFKDIPTEYLISKLKELEIGYSLDDINKFVTEIIKDLPNTGNTKLESQIDFMNKINKVFKTPITTSILNSLIELRNIKQKQIEKLKSELK